MLWLHAESLIVLGMTNATRNGFAAPITPSYPTTIPISINTSTAFLNLIVSLLFDLLI